MISIFCVDVGSVSGNKFRWFGKRSDSTECSGDDPTSLIESIAQDRAKNDAVALGFECPLFLPVPEEATALGRARANEGNRPWSAGAGSSVLTTGLAQIAWIARALTRAEPGVALTLDAKAFASAPSGIFLWEAFVSGNSKTGTHHGDAKAAVYKFSDQFNAGLPGSAVTCDNPMSLAGFALLFAGSSDLSLLQTPCYVVKA